MTEHPSDVGFYYYFIHTSWGVEECADILRALLGKFTRDEWVDALNRSEKIHEGEVGRAGGIIFIRSAGPSLDFSENCVTATTRCVAPLLPLIIENPAAFPTSPSTAPWSQGQD